jgi:amino acid adenylation domain-containing protein
VEDLTGRLAGLSPDKRALLEALVQKKRARSASAVPPLQPRDAAGGPPPLSFSQERLWLIDQLEPGSPAYNLPLALRLTGELSPGLLARVFAEIVRRHEALRTTFATVSGRPVQVIAAPEVRTLRPLLPLLDLTGLPAAPREEAALRLAREEARRPFDLRQGPLLRLALVRLEPRSHLLLLTMHHIVSDGWSLGVLLRELKTLFEAFAGGRPSPLPEPPVQYADFALWQRSWMRGEELDRQLSFWKRRLAGAPRVLELPTDRSRPPSRRRLGGLVPFALSAGRTAALQELARREGSTLFVLLLAAFQTLLHRWSGQEDLLVGTPVAGRRQEAVEGLIGCFINSLVLRGRFDPATPFRALLGRTWEETLGAFDHQDLPFERLVEELAPDRDGLVSPLFQVLFALQNTPLPAVELPGLTLRALPQDAGAKLDLSLTLQETAGGLAGSLEYDAALFDRSTAERLLARFATLLAGVAGDPGRPAGELPLLPAAERHQAVVEWNDTASFYPREAGLPELFSEVARRMPEAQALVAPDGEVWSYRRLDEESARLARRLRALGVVPETAVGLCLERSPELILGTLAILKAGGAYVPLDAGYPDERLAFMLADTGARVVLVHGPTRERMERLGLELIELGEKDIKDSKDIKDEAHSSLESLTSLEPFASLPESLAYVIYTSGSTGRPKGVAVPHRGVVRLVRETNYVRLGPGARTGHVANISFDAATYEIWGALLTGAAVVVIPREVVLSPADLAGWIRERGVTSMFLTSALFTRMSREVPDAFATMSELLVGGEAVDPAAARAVLAGRPPRRLLNGYGPTESTTFATWHPIREVAEGAASVPIGSPLANTTLYVLDRWQAVVPPGSPGELCIGGDGLARGYLNRPELTAERFVPHPWEDGERLYRTGDLVRQRPDGALDYLGRLDHQVKIRGFRIEPGEIEAVLAGHPDVRECAVLARQDELRGPGETRLVAYAVLHPGAKRPVSALRAWLQERLPEYMVPSAFVGLDALPLTPNGKLDRRALAALEPGGAAGTAAQGPPADPVEELLAGIWTEVLQLPAVGVRDDFFALGGHSLLATQVASRVREVLGVDLPLRALFAAPTVEALARTVRAARPEGGSLAPPILPASRQAELPLSFAQQRLWVIDLLEPGNPAYNVPFAASLSGELSPALLARIFAEIVRRHEALRTTFAIRADRPVQVISPEVRVELPVVDLAELPPAEREARARRLALEEARRPFDLRRGPLLRLALVRLAAREHVLLLNLHHIVSDGWSLGVLLRELEALHTAFSRGRRSPLPELPVQYADFAVWQRSWLQGEALATQLGFWKRRLAGAPHLLELPLDRPRPAVQTFDGAVHPMTLSPSLTEAVRGLCQVQGVTPFMALLAAWTVLLGRHAGQEDVVVGSPIAGRNRREIEGLIGFFVNTLALRADLSGSPTFGELLGQVRQTALDAYAHQDVPFERIVEEVAVERDLAVSPLFQVLFVLQNAPVGDLAVPGLQISPLALDTGLTKLDLSLTLGEGPAGLSGALEYNTGLFDAGTAEWLTSRFLALLEAAVREPGLPVTDLPILLPAERLQLLAWNETEAPPASARCLHELFAAQAARTPEQTALVAGAERLTYAELAARAGGLARHLRSLGVGPEVRVAVCLERSPDLIAALLGVLAAGGVYVPIDPAYPAERQALMVEDSGAAVLMTRRDLEAAAIPAAPLPALLQDNSGVTPDHLAYLIYTSGSTGRPKGVAIEHRSAAALVAWAREEFSAEELSGVLASTSVCFDLSVFEIFVTLALGGKILLADNALALPSLPEAGEVRLLNTVPSAAAELVRSGGLPASVRTVCLAGEPLPAALAARLYATGTVERVLNLYGPSEDTTYSTGALVPREVDRAPAIGRPIRGTRAHVVDRSGALVPPGVAGELWLAGAGLARGYLGRPELTAERFTPDPLGGPGDRVYRTGDLVRRRSDGELEFLGRIDHQVKLRGFRIELGEIEAVLGSHASMRECVVAVREDLLVAWVCLEPADPTDRTDASDLKSALAAWLRQRLPEFMVPSLFVFLDALPLSPNGKVDRRALPAPDRRGSREHATDLFDGATVERLLGRSERLPGSAPADGGDREPSNPLEELLAGIWAEVLGLDRVGVDEDFFSLGGHSLLAVRAVSRVRGVFGVELPLRQVFKTPTVAGFARVVRAAGIGSAAAPPLVPVSREGDLPLSFAQQRLWLIDQIEPGSPAYNMPFAVRLTGDLSPAFLERIFGEVVRRHEILRTTFAVRGDRPVQVIAPRLLVELPVVDLSPLPATQRETRARELARDEARRPFDLYRGPLLRLALVRLDGREHLLLVTLHHIVGDGWSLGVLLREIAALWGGRALPELPVQYADFAVWQQEWLRGEVLEGQLGYWRRQLAGAPRQLELPLDRPRPAVQTSNGAQQPAALSPGLSEAVRSLSRQHGVTPFMVLLAAWAVLLGRHADQDDVLIGSPVAGRNRREIEGLIGFFVNTLVLRISLAPLTFRELLGQILELALDGHAHQDVPFERIVEEVVTERDLAVPPLFQVLFALQNAPTGELRLPGLTLSPVEAAGGTAKFDLSLVLGEVSGSFAGSLEYATDLFDRTTIERLLRHFAHLLANATTDPGLPLSELRLMDAAEERMLIVELNQAERSWALPVAVHDLFARQAGKTPGKAAAVGPQGEMTYRELDERSTALARALGAGPLDRRTALLADPDPQVLVGMLGILKAGSGFVPMDPRHPDERLAWLLDDAACEVLVTPRHHLERAQGLARGGRVLCLDEGKAGAALPVGHEPRSLAYVVYTSGSTGRPKGVQVSHQSLVPMLLWGCDHFGLGEHTRVLQSLSFCFDFGIFEHLTTVLAGGTLVFPGEAAGDPAALAREIVRHGINTLHTTPALARELAASLENLETLDSLEILHLGGEALTRDTVDRLREAAPRAAIYNGYGPTEATVNSSIFRIPREAGWPVVPIGRRSADNALYILDRAGRLAPFGARGELHVGGIGVARGYLNRPDLTAERFVPDPFGAEPGGRLYRTGDLVRYLPEGDIEFLGRIDHQVKVRGFRIELGEIEAILGSHPEVRECAAAVWAEGGDPRLVAWVCFDPTDRTDPSDLKSALSAWLRERLPEPMVPSAFVVLDALPLSPNGKVDRRALPAPERVRPGRDLVAPRTKTEETLAAIWQELLGLDQVSVEDRFFELGGHSLLATRVLTRVRRTWGIDLPLRELFRHPTIAGLAELIDSSLLTPLPLAEEGLGVRASSGPWLLSFSQERLWVLDQLEPGTPAYNIPLAVRLTGEIAPALLARIFTEIVRRHEALRTTFAVRDGRPVQVVAEELRPELPLIDLSDLPDLPEAEAFRIARAEAGRSFDLRRGPLLRLALLRLGPRSHLLLLTMHHIVSDGWSMGVLLREIQVLAEAFARGLPSPLPELPVQYADFALWQRNRLQGEVLAAQLDWWRRELAGAPGVLPLPTDRPRSPLQSREGALVPLALPPGLTARLQALARREDATLFMLLLAAFQALLHRLGGAEDVLVGTPVANRRQMETENLIGFFVNTLVLRGRLASPALTFGDLLRQTRETVLGAFEHQDAPFERLVEELVPGRDLSVSPLFQVLFSLQTASAAPVSLPGLTLEALPAYSGKAQFDLSLDLAEAGGEMRGSLEISRALFDLATARRMLALFVHLLHAAAEAPERRIAEIPLLDAAQCHQLLREWSEGGALPAGDVSILPLFERRAADAPDAPALSQEGRRLTYGQLDRRANQLAHRLRRLGVGPETPVAVPAERTPELIVAFLGILKAGGVYVPLDPAYPEERRAFMLEDSRAVLLGPEHLSSLEEESAEAPPRTLSPEHLAYVLYTSGSTGHPKGVMVSHEALARYANAIRPVYGIGPGDRVLQFCSTSFDTSLEEIVGALTAGAELVLRTDSMLGSVPTFLESCGAQGMTVLSLPTAYWHEIAAKLEMEPSPARPHPLGPPLPSLPHRPGEGEVARSNVREAAGGGFPLSRWKGERWERGTEGVRSTKVPSPRDLDEALLPPSLRLVILGGERALAARVASWRRAAGRPRLLNTYGVTESTIVSTATDLATASTAEARGEVSIGRAIRGTEVLLLDREMAPVPIGTAGELHLGGGLLARGYLRRPDLTAERFVPHPFAPEPGARLYRTGDLARASHEGELEVLGRADRQVKIRGYRIETAEIEARLLLHPEIESAVVAVREDRPGEKLLAAYLVPRQAPGPSPAALRAFVRDALPDYMVPSAFVILDALPLSPNGKVDREALPAPERAAGAEHLGARDALELQIVQVWEEVLGVRPIGVRDDFFGLGGHSLLAVQVTTRLQSRLGRSLPLASLLRHPTPERLAALLRQEAGPVDRSPLVELASGRERPLFLVHPVGGEVLCYVPLARRLDRPVFGLQAGLQAPEEELALEEMADLYLRHVREVQPEGPYLLGGWSLGGAIAFEMARRLEASGEIVERVILIDSYAPGDLWQEETGEAALVASFANDLARLLGTGGIALPEGFGEHSRDEALDWLAAQAEEAGLLPPGLGAAELRRRFATFAANHHAMTRYAGGPCAAPLLLIRAAEPASGEPDLGWGRIAGRPVEVHEVLGDHYTLLREPAVERIATLVHERLGTLAPGGRTKTEWNPIPS